MEKDITVTSPLLPDLEEFHELLKDIWERRWITNNGEYHQQLEQALAEYLKVAVCESLHQWYIAASDSPAGTSHNRRGHHYPIQFCGNHTQHLVERLQTSLCGLLLVRLLILGAKFVPHWKRQVIVC